jgi:septal ring factor EnvC (AmiA/AmiB activator)
MGGNYYMPMGGQRSYNSPNPLNFNYPKIDHIRNHQYSNYPKFKEESEKKKDEKEQITENLAKELEEQIKELQQLTKEAKELAKKKKVREEETSKSTAFLQVSETNNFKDNNQIVTSNLDQVIFVFI